jgi:hypothetical protein
LCSPSSPLRPRRSQSPQRLRRLHHPFAYVACPAPLASHRRHSDDTCPSRSRCSRSSACCCRPRGSVGRRHSRPLPVHLSLRLGPCSGLPPTGCVANADCARLIAPAARHQTRCCPGHLPLPFPMPHHFTFSLSVRACFSAPLSTVYYCVLHNVKSLYEMLQLQHHSSGHLRLLDTGAYRKNTDFKTPPRRVHSAAHAGGGSGGVRCFGLVTPYISVTPGVSRPGFRSQKPDQKPKLKA